MANNEDLSANLADLTKQIDTLQMELESSNLEKSQLSADSEARRLRIEKFTADTDALKKKLEAANL